MSSKSGQFVDEILKFHSMIILALDYKLSKTGEYINIPIRKYSGSFVEPSSETRAGILFTAEVSAYIPNLDDTKNATIDLLTHRPAIYRVKDASGHYHVIGNDAELAKLTSTKKIGPTPGTFYGWDIKITCVTVAGSQMSSFSN